MRSSRARWVSLVTFPVVVSLTALSFGGCGEDAEAIVGFDAAADIPFIDAGGSVDRDAGDATSADGGDAALDSGPTDTTPPGSVGDLAATTKNHSAIDLSWSAPSDDPDAGPSAPDAGQGTVAGYDVRVSTAPITNLTEFLAATAVAAPPAPSAAGQQQTLTVTGLAPNTTYHFAIRARDAAGNFGALSNDASATTRPRAKLLISEVAVANVAADGYDFVEAVVTEAGWAEDLEIRQLNTTLYKLGPVTLAVGDRVVVHATGLPGPTGFAQEDTQSDKTLSTASFASPDAYDVYSETTTLTATDNLITVMDATAIVDALALSNRDSDAAAATMNAWAAAKAAGAWAFTVTPTDGQNDCATQRDAVNVTSDATDALCGGRATGYGRGLSINRRGTTDTNSKADFYLAAQTPGATNGPLPGFHVVAVKATAATTLEVTFDGEVDPATALTASFTVPGLTVNTATVTNVDRVSLTTTTQAATAYDLAIANTVADIQGTAVSTPSAHVCGFSATPPSMILNEVNAAISGGADLIELEVTARGNLGDFELVQNPVAAATGTVIAKLPTICAEAGDIVVVHLGPGTAGVASTSEWLVGKSELPQVTFAANYDAAWDVLGISGLGNTSQVIALARSGAIVDATPFTNNNVGQAPVAFIPALNHVQSLSLWTPADCGGAACSAVTTPTAFEVSAVWSGSSASSTGASVRRLRPVVSTSAGWSVGASSFGLPNP